MYRARKPFHPKRLFDLIHDKFIILQNVDQVGTGVEQEEGDEDEAENMDSQNEDEADGSVSDSDTDMIDDLDGKTFETNIDPKVSRILSN